MYTTKSTRCSSKITSCVCSSTASTRLEHKVKQMSCPRLYLSRVDVQTMGSALNYEENKTKLIVEVKPNGFRYELPIHVSFKSKGSQMSLMRSISSIISDMTQYTIDSLSLTLLLNARCTTGQGISNHDDSLNKSSSIAYKTTAAATEMAKNGHNENDITACEGDNYDESIIRIFTVKDDARIKFPPVCVTQRGSIEFELNNYRETHVIWKAYSIAPAFRSQVSLMRSISQCSLST